MTATSKAKKRGETVHCFNWLSNHLTSEKEVRMYTSDALLLNASHAVITAMEIAGLNRAQLSQKIGKSKSFVSQVLSGNRNVTLKTLADLLWACGKEVGTFELQRLGDMKVPLESIDGWLDTETAHRTAEASEAVVSGEQGLSFLIANQHHDHDAVAA